jgi:hypothetical protein
VNDRRGWLLSTERAAFAVLALLLVACGAPSLPATSTPVVSTATVAPVTPPSFTPTANPPTFTPSIVPSATTRPLEPSATTLVPTATVAPSPLPTVAQSQLGQRTRTAGCQVNNALPDSACTPGAIFASATKEQICQPGYATSVRDVSSAEKDQVYAEYGITSHPTGAYEVDHLVSLELGGSNDIANLWPEAADPRPGFHEKDQVENKLHDQVCAGAISRQEAQVQIATNWLDVYNRGPTTPAATSPLLPTTPTLPTLTVSPQLTATGAASGTFTASATVSNATPSRNQTVTVSAKLVDGAGNGVPGATMLATWHYKTTTSTCSGGPTTTEGLASCSRDIGGASAGYSVRVDVVFTLNGQTYTTSTSFTPR